MMPPDGAPPVETAPSAVPAPPNPLVPIPLSAEDLQFFREEITRARKFRTDTISQWGVKENLERYTPRSVKDNRGQLIADVNVAKDFSDVERKNAALFHSTPQIALIPDPGTNPVALMLHQELINTLLSDEYMDALETVSPAIQDCLVAIQPVPTEIGYTAVTVNVDQQTPVIDPVTKQPAIDPMTQQPMMQTQSVPVIVWEEFFWEHISPRAALVPVSVKNTKYDKAPWLGHDFRKPKSWAVKTYGLPAEFTGGDSENGEKPYFEPIVEATDDGEPHVSGTKLWYRASLRDPNVSHPELIRELVLIEGSDEPAVHRNCPYQTIGPDGRLTPDSIIGYPEHPLALRNLTDSSHVASDCTLTGPLTLELNKSRTTNVLERDGSRLHVLYDPSRLNPEARDKVTSSDAPKFIAVEPGALDAGMDKVMGQVPALTQGREKFLIQDIIERDRAQILGIDANQVGAPSGSSKTATEVSTVQRNADARFNREQNRATRWFLKGVQKVSALVLRYGDRIAVEILGPQRGAAWVQARDQGQFAKFTFKTVIDTGNYQDIEARKRQDLQLYNLTAKDPSLNRSEVQKRLATDFGMDPATWLVTKPPEQKPEPITMSMSFKTEDLDPALPSYVNTYAVLKAAGVPGLQPPTYVPPPAAPPLEAGHGGMAELTPRLNQHQLNESGEQPGPAVM